MKQHLAVILVLFTPFIFSCKKDFNRQTGNNLIEELGRHDTKALKIAIISDIHYMHPALLINNGANGTAFQNYLNQDPKLLQFSDPIFRNVMDQISIEHPDILLIPGDLTKDGEKIGHQAMASFFNKIQNDGIKVYVVPGNHDINNAKAKKYDGNNDYPVSITSKTDFENIYNDFGYKNAIARDINSLSYVVEPEPDLRIIGIDACKYEEYGPEGDVAAGRIKPTTLIWILDQLAKAKQEHVTIFAMMHHNLIEHYAGQAKLDPGYVIDDYQKVVNQLIEAGLKIIFTGHYHANDITSYHHNGKELFDIETGSLVTAPSPYRFIVMNDSMLNICTRTVHFINANLPGSLNFPVYANTFLSQHLDGYFNYYLTSKLGAPAQLATFASPLFRNGIMAHFAGDEKMPADQRKQIDNLATMSPQLAGIVTTLWTDLGIKDNNTSIKYK